MKIYLCLCTEVKEKAHRGRLKVKRVGSFSDRKKKNQFCLHAAHIGLKDSSDFCMCFVVLS